ncbi:NAD(P)-dependent oxidoreductase [Acidobacteriota bacterium]
MKLLIASSIYKDAIEKLRENHDVICAFGAPEEELKLAIQDRDILVFRSGVDINARVMAAASNLKLLIRAGSGVDNLDMDYVKQNKVQLIRIPEPGAKAVAELSFLHMLALSRTLIYGDRSLREGRWVKSEMKGFLLTGKTLGIIGVGNIGSRVAKIGSSWDLNVMGCVKHPNEKRVKKLWDQYKVELTDFDDVISKADYISIHVPLDKSTRYMFNENVFRKVKPGAFLVNLARGGVVDEKALYKAIVEDKVIRGAALDVHENEGEGKISILAGLPNVVLSPHIGAQTIDSQKEIGDRILEIMDNLNF